ncbi:hypothetical protein BH23ACT9_BH23ACT9_22250 [soil metagenome]
MIRYLIDSSALWRLLRDDDLRAAWAPIVAEGAVGSCSAQRTEFRRSARNPTEFRDMNHMFDTLYADVAVPKTAWRWAETAQHALVAAGAHRALSVTDLLICATAARRGLAVLHDDNDFTAASRHLTDVAEHRVLDIPHTDRRGD